MTNSVPRYRELAHILRKDIQSRQLAPGTALMTEMEICAKHDVSRHTAREALRILTEDGLIERRRGAGTVVAQPRAPTFAQSIGDFDSLLQYARDARLDISQAYPADDDTLDRLGLTGQFVCFEGLRRVGDEPPQALSRVLADARFGITAATLNSLNGPIFEWLETEHGVAIARVTQRMEACLLGSQQAERLEVQSGTAALRTIRRYRDADGAIVLLSENLHPAGRFAYEMRLERK